MLKSKILKICLILVLLSNIKQTILFAVKNRIQNKFDPIFVLKNDNQKDSINNFINNKDLIKSYDFEYKIPTSLLDSISYGPCKFWGFELPADSIYITSIGYKKVKI